MHDRESRAQCSKVACDTLVPWGARGVVNRLFDPMALLWQAQWRGCGAGHGGRAFIPEELPQATAAALNVFFL